MPHKIDRENCVIELNRVFELTENQLDRENHVIELTEHQLNAVSGGEITISKQFDKASSGLYHDAVKP